MISKINKFIEETKLELHKVTWPSKEETIRLTYTVIVISILFSVYLGLLDFSFNKILNSVIR